MWSISYRLKKLCDIWRNYSGQILRFFLNFVFQFNYTAIDSISNLSLISYETSDLGTSSIFDVSFFICIIFSLTFPVNS